MGMTPLARHHDVSGTDFFGKELLPDGMRFSAIPGATATGMAFGTSATMTGHLVRPYYGVGFVRFKRSRGPLTHYQRENEPHACRDCYRLQRVSPDRHG